VPAVCVPVGLELGARAAATVGETRPRFPDGAGRCLPPSEPRAKRGAIWWRSAGAQLPGRAGVLLTRRASFCRHRVGVSRPSVTSVLLNDSHVSEGRHVAFLDLLYPSSLVGLGDNYLDLALRIRLGLVSASIRAGPLRASSFVGKCPLLAVQYHRLDSSRAVTSGSPVSRSQSPSLSI